MGTALQIVQQAAAELGLPVPVTVYQSREQTAVQMLALLNSCGNELMVSFQWEHLLKLANITTVAGQSRYDKPSDFGWMINQTLWDQANRRPVVGPQSPQSWQILTNALLGTGPFSRYRVQGNMLEFQPTPQADGLNFNYQYISNGWIQTYLDPNLYVSFVTADNDEVLFDFWLIVKFLKLKMWEAKGMDTAHLVSDFTRIYTAVTGQDHGAPILSLAPRWKYPYITPFNVPDGSWVVA